MIQELLSNVSSNPIGIAPQKDSLRTIEEVTLKKEKFSQNMEELNKLQEKEPMREVESNLDSPKTVAGESVLANHFLLQMMQKTEMEDESIRDVIWQEDIGIADLLAEIANKEMLEQKEEASHLSEITKRVESLAYMMQVYVTESVESSDSLSKEMRQWIQRITEMENSLENLSDSLKNLEEMIKTITSRNGIASPIMDEIKTINQQLEQSIHQLGQDISIKEEIISLKTGDLHRKEDVFLSMSKIGGLTSNVEMVKNEKTNWMTKDSVFELDGVGMMTMETKEGMKQDNAMKWLELTPEQFKETLKEKIQDIQKLSIQRDKMLIQLRPEHLGRVELFFQKTEHGIEISIDLEKLNMKQNVETVLEELQKEFKERNITLQFDFREHREDVDDEKEKESQRKEEFVNEERKEEKGKEVFDEILEEILSEVR